MLSLSRTNRSAWIFGLVAACGPRSDADRDGWTTEAGDCDDGDPSRNPGQIEICDDEIDQDCVSSSCRFPEQGDALAVFEMRYLPFPTLQGAVWPGENRLVLSGHGVMGHGVMGQVDIIDIFFEAHNTVFLPEDPFGPVGSTGVIVSGADLFSMLDGKLIYEFGVRINQFAPYAGAAWVMANDAPVLCTVAGCTDAPPVPRASTVEGWYLGGRYPLAAPVNEDELWLMTRFTHRGYDVYSYPSNTRLWHEDQLGGEEVPAYRTEAVVLKRPPEPGRPGQGHALVFEADRSGHEWLDALVVLEPDRSFVARILLPARSAHIQPTAFDADQDDVDDLFVSTWDETGPLLAGFDGDRLDGELTLDDARWMVRFPGGSSIDFGVTDLDGDGDLDLVAIQPSNGMYFLGYNRSE